MTTVILVIYVMLVIALISLILIQKSEGGGLGIGGGGMSGLMTGRSSANFITRLTTGLIAGFMVVSLLINILSKMDHRGESITDRVGKAAVTTPALPLPASPDRAPSASPQEPKAETPKADAEKAPEKTEPAAPTVPLAR